MGLGVDVKVGTNMVVIYFAVSPVNEISKRRLAVQSWVERSERLMMVHRLKARR